MSDKYRLKDWLFTQGRFRHLKNPKWAYLIDEFQSRIDVQWDWLLKQEKRAYQPGFLSGLPAEILLLS